MFFYCVFAVIIIWPRRAAVAVLAAAFLIWVAAGAVFAFPAPLRFLSHSIVLEFVFGALIGLAYLEGIRVSRLLGRLMIAAAVLILAFGYAVNYVPFLIAPISPPRFIGLGLPAALIVAGAALQEPRRSMSMASIAMQKLGDASYAIYLLHPIVFIVARYSWPSVHSSAQLVLPAPIAGTAAAWIYATLAVGGTLGLSVLTHACFERPVTKYLTRQLVGRRRVDGPATALNPSA
jgi:exopolysaccharide production protein ExoZ